MWPLECKQEFPKIWPGNLVFDPTWPIFELDLDIVKTNILTKFYKNCITNVDRRRTTDDGRRITKDDGEPLTTIAHNEHAVLRWAKNNKGQLLKSYEADSYVFIPDKMWTNGRTEGQTEGQNIDYTLFHRGA